MDKHSPLRTMCDGLLVYFWAEFEPLTKYVKSVRSIYTACYDKRSERRLESHCLVWSRTTWRSTVLVLLDLRHRVQHVHSSDERKCNLKYDWTLWKTWLQWAQNAYMNRLDNRWKSVTENRSMGTWLCFDIWNPRSAAAIISITRNRCLHEPI